MRVHDISVALRDDLPTWPGEEGLRREVMASLPEDPVTVSHLAFSAHTGTHIDAPVHFLVDGHGMDAYDPAKFVGPCVVVDMRHVEREITADDLENAGIADDASRILTLTGNSGWSRTDTEFRPDYVAYARSAAEWLLERRVELVGNDYLSVEMFDSEDFGVHKTLLGGGVAILEGVDLDGVAPGNYELSALPILVPGSDGAPTRAVLIER